MPFNPFAPIVAGMTKQADTGPAGFALQNATPTILSWTVPNDGNAHPVLIMASQYVTSAETGGAVSATITVPSGNSGSPTLFSAGHGTGLFPPSGTLTMIAEAGSTVTIQQSSALTVGAATVWAQIWAA